MTMQDKAKMKDDKPCDCMGCRCRKDGHWKNAARYLLDALRKGSGSPKHDKKCQEFVEGYLTMPDREQRELAAQFIYGFNAYLNHIENENQRETAVEVVQSVFGPRPTVN